MNSNLDDKSYADLIAQAETNPMLDSKARKFLNSIKGRTMLTRGMVDYLESLANKATATLSQASGKYRCHSCGTNISPKGEAIKTGGEPISSDGHVRYDTQTPPPYPPPKYLCVHCWDEQHGHGHRTNSPTITPEIGARFLKRLQDGRIGIGKIQDPYGKGELECKNGIWYKSYPNGMIKQYGYPNKIKYPNQDWIIDPHSSSEPDGF